MLLHSGDLSYALKFCMLLSFTGTVW